MQVDNYSCEGECDLLLDYLLKEEIDIKLVDSFGNTAAFYAIQNERKEAADKIIQKGGLLKTTIKRVFKAIKANNER